MHLQVREEEEKVRNTRACLLALPRRAEWGVRVAR
jgi:hypothetical protein